MVTTQRQKGNELRERNMNTGLPKVCWKDAEPHMPHTLGKAQDCRNERLRVPEDDPLKQHKSARTRRVSDGGAEPVRSQKVLMF